MKAKKIIRYRVSVSRFFPAKHPKAGQETNFVEKIQANGISYITEIEPKIYTIRANYALWEKRFKKIEKGEAVLELYYWTGKPYNSTCKTFATLKKEDGIGLQQLFFLCRNIYDPIVDPAEPDLDELARHDGLSVEDFKAWFKGYDLSESLAIIHFTDFRY